MQPRFRVAKQKSQNLRPSAWDISAELTLRGYVNERGRPFSAASIAAMLAPGLLKPTRMLKPEKVFAMSEIISPTSGLNAILGAALVPSG